MIRFFLFRLAGVLPQVLHVVEIEAPGICGGGHAARRLVLAAMLQPVEPGVAHHLDVAHHVRIADGYEALRAPKFTDRDLEGHRVAHHHAAPTRQHVLFFGIEFQV